MLEKSIKVLPGPPQVLRSRLRIADEVLDLEAGRLGLESHSRPLTVIQANHLIFLSLRFFSQKKKMETIVIASFSELL